MGCWIVASILFLASLASGIGTGVHLQVAFFSIVADFPIDSGGPAAVDISSAILSDITDVPAVVGLPECF